MELRFNEHVWKHGSIWIPAEEWALIVAWNADHLDAYDIKRRAATLLPEHSTENLIGDYLLPAFHMRQCHVAYDGELLDHLSAVRERRA